MSCALNRLTMEASVYPESPGYQRHSDTSREAADKLTGQGLQHRLILEAMTRNGMKGLTIDEAAAMLTDHLERHIHSGTAAARMGELEKAGKVCKTPQRRKTRSGRNAVVYLKGSWTDYMVPAEGPVSMPHVTPPSQIETYKAQQAQHGHGHIIPRNDGRKEGCGGPSLCRICKQVKAYFESMQGR